MITSERIFWSPLEWRTFANYTDEMREQFWSELRSAAISVLHESVAVCPVDSMFFVLAEVDEVPIIEARALPRESYDRIVETLELDRSLVEKCFAELDHAERVVLFVAARGNGTFAYAALSRTFAMTTLKGGNA